MEILYNGIRLPEEWPPRYSVEQLEEEMPLPYLQNPPEVIEINVGRQLFVDDFLIEQTTLERVCHRAKKYEGNPVLKPETPWECDATIPAACPKSGGVWWDSKEKIYKMWYEAGWLHHMAYATSHDGIHWERPELDVVPGTNKILPYGAERRDLSYAPGYPRPDSTTVWIDDTCAPEERYKLFLRCPGGLQCGILMTSADGIHWENETETTPMGDRSTAFYNPFRKKWVYSIRNGWPLRARDYAEHDDFLAGAQWGDSAVRWLRCDKTDRPHPYIQTRPALYNVDAVAYESVMLGMFEIFYGPENEIDFASGAPKCTELIAMYSRDGFHFSRPTNESIIPASLHAGSWDRGYVQSVGGVCLVYDDEIRIYYIGFAGDESKGGVCDPEYPGDFSRHWMYGNGATGFATLRRDGFVSMEAKQNVGTLLTRKLRFTDRCALFANFTGTLTAELLDETGNVLAVSVPCTADSTKQKLDFGAFPVESLSGKPIRVRFALENGALYSFWFGDEAGNSFGYLGAGNPEAAE